MTTTNATHTLSRKRYPWLQGLIILFLIGIVVTGVGVLSHFEHRWVAVGGASLSLAAAEVAGEIDHFLFGHYTALDTLASHLGHELHQTGSLQRALGLIKQSPQGSLWAAIMDEHGRITVASDGSLVEGDQAWDKWFPALRTNMQPRVAVVDIEDERLKRMGGKTLALAVPIVNQRGAFRGAVVSLLDPLALEDLVLKAIQTTESRVPFLVGEAYHLEYQVVTQEGLAFLDSDSQRQGRLIAQALQTESARLSANREAGYVEEQHWRRQVPIVSGYARTEGSHGIEGLDWFVFVRTDRSLIASPVEELRWMLGGLLLLIGLPVVGFLLWTSGRLQRDYSRAYQESVEAKQAEQTLSEREERARLIVDTALDALISMDEEGRIVDWNLQAERTFGWLREEAIGHPLLAKIIPQHYQEIEELGMRRFLATGESAQLNKLIEVTATRRDGSGFAAELTVSPARIRDRFLFTVFLRDISERKQRERHLALQYAVTRVLSEAVTIEEASPHVLQTLCKNLEWELGIFWSVDQEAEALELVEIWHMRGEGTAEFVAANRNHVVRPGVGLPGRVWAQGMPVWVPDVSKDSNFPQAAAAGQAGLHSAFAFPIRVGDTILGVLEFLSHDIREPDEDLLQMVVDIGVKVGQFVERKRAEAALRNTEDQLRQSQKMEAIGRVAGGVAHDFNNLLTVITGYTQLLLHQLGPNDRMRYEIEEIKKAGSRAAALTGQLLAFSRRQAVSLQAVNLNTVVSNMEGMLRRLLGEDIIELATVQAPDLGKIKADPSQLDQVVMNLAVNACDAMPHGGRLTLETANVTIPSDGPHHPGAIEPGSYVVLTMTDTGSGMSDKTLAHVFEPFFTTKDKGKGTGLGLSTVYGIVKQNGGHISVESQLGQGSTFKVYFPRVDVQDNEAERVTVPQVAYAAGETILVVEDEPGVRGLVREMLKQRGYTVLEARDGINAQVVSKGHFGPIDLLLTDVVMPQKSGPEAAKELLSDRPSMKVLYMSGYPDHPVFSNGPLDKGRLLLQKPFTPETLVRKVREVLDMPAEEFKSTHLVG